MDEKYHEMWINNVQIISAITHLFTNTTKVNRTNGHGLGVPNKDGRPIQTQNPERKPLTAGHGWPLVSYGVDET